MTSTVDATLLAALDNQFSALDRALARLELARSTLVPAPATFWRGTARNAYDSAVGALGTTVDAGILALASARTNTSRAISIMTYRA